MSIVVGSSGKTSTSYVEISLQCTNIRPHDKRSIVESIEFIVREDTPLLSKISTGQKAIQNRHSWM